MLGHCLLLSVSYHTALHIQLSAVCAAWCLSSGASGAREQLQMGDRCDHAQVTRQDLGKPA